MSDVRYNDRVTEHFERPRNVAVEALVPNAQLKRVSGEGGGIDSGVWIQFELLIDPQRIIDRVQFRAYGCPHTIALASWLTDELVGERLVERYTLDHDRLVGLFDLPAEKLRSVLVAEDALRACAHTLYAKDA